MKLRLLDYSIIEVSEVDSNVNLNSHLKYLNLIQGIGDNY